MKLNIDPKPAPPGAALRIFALKGQLETNTVPHFEAFVARELGAGPPFWLVEASGVDYISSAGLAALVGLRHSLVAQKGMLAFSGMTPKVFKVFELLGMVPLFEYYPDEHAAMIGLRRP